ncbi:MAG TPA: hypothetical protein VFN55_10235, partial [Solirubrobacteraceae bacterium]|nr:hypothetical protein [Solirubrobacteraceae bacterium]
GCFDFPATPAFAVIQAVRSAPAAGYTKRLDATQTGSCQDQNGGTETATRSIHAKLIVGGGGPAAPEKPPGPSQQQRQKIFAQGDLLATLLRAQGPCGLVALGTTTVVWSSTVGGPTAPAALIPAEFLLSAGAPMCAAYATQIYLDVQIINDPPRGDVTVIARPAPTPSSAAAARTLPSCASKPAALRSFCSALRGDLAQEIAAAQRSAALAAALLTTVDRETAARRSHRGAALQRQLAAGDRLVAALRATERSQRTLGSMISGRIAAQHVTGQLTAAQDATAISALLRRLRARGVTRATLQRRAPSALTAGPYDLLAHLG